MPTSPHTLARQCAPRTVIHLDAHRPVVMRIDDGAEPRTPEQYATVERINEGLEMLKQRNSIPACTSDRRHQSDRKCPTPDACRLPDPEDVHRWPLAWIALGFVLASWPGRLVVACVLAALAAFVVLVGGAQ